MNSKFLVIIVVFVIALGGFAFFANKTENPTTTNNPSSIQTDVPATSAPIDIKNQTTSVILSDAGFEPKDITIKAGTIVVWVNKSGKEATVSSDDHPTHRLYQFLNLGEFPNSSSLQAVFDKPGKYTYHDHFNASRTGTVTVE